MTSQSTFSAFEKEAEHRGEFPNQWGPTMDEPIPEAERMALHESGGDLVDEREIPDSGLSLSDITDWPYINEERDRPKRRQEEVEILAKLESENERSHNAGGKELAADGGEIVEPKTDYEPGDRVLIIEDVAVGLMSPPSILEAEVSSSGKSVMIPEDSDSIHGRRRLDGEKIFAGESEYRDSTGYELYTPGRFRNNQRSNYGPGPQAGADSISETDELPEPTHWPTGDQPDDAPDECPVCGATGPWQDVGRPRCEHCGETVDPDAGDQDDDSEAMPDKWDLSQLDRGDTLILENYRGEFLISRIHYMRNTRNQQVNRIEAVKREGGEWREYTIQKLTRTDGYRLKVTREGGPAAFINVDDPEHAQDFEKTGSDMDKLRRYLRQRYE